MSRGASLSAADRLARLIQRYGLSIDKVATKLGWKIEKLRAFLAPHARRIKATTDIDDTAVEKLLMRYRLALAHQTLTQAPRTSLQPLESSARRSTLPTQFGRNVVDKRSIIRADITPTQLKASKEMEQHLPSSRKRKRRPIVLPLTTSPATIKTEALKEKTRNDKVETGSKRPYRDVRKRARSELLCPIRLDIDLDGVRFQDTFLVNAALTTCSPEMLATVIAQDEHMSEPLRDAIAESIRRQILLFTSCLRVPDSRGGRLYPIYLDLILDGFSLRDQFEWDLANDSLAAHAFACSLCADLNLPPPFEAAIVFSILEQVVAYRLATSGHQWIGTNPFQVEQGTTCSSGYMETMPRLDEIVRDTEDAQLWQPVLSELSREEVTYFTERVQATRAPTSSAKSVAAKEQPHARANRAARSTTLSKDTRLPRPINPFIVYCQMQKEALGRTRRSASEMRKIMGDMWRKCSEEEKEYYAHVTEVENEKRRRDYILDLRDRAIADWEEEEARRKGLLASSILEASTEHFRGLLLENYMSERHEVDMNRQRAAPKPAEEEEEEHEMT